MKKDYKKIIVIGIIVALIVAGFIIYSSFKEEDQFSPPVKIRSKKYILVQLQTK